MALSRFTNEQVNGATIIGIASIIALLCLSLTLLHLFLALVHPAYSSRLSSPQERHFITSPLGLYIICLFLSNFISALGGVVEFQWAVFRGITEGPSCTVQAILLQLGNNAAALWLGVLSLSALRTFVLKARPWRRVIILPLIFALWIFMISFDSAASTIFNNNPARFYYGNASLWCWITPFFRAQRMLTQYVWMWIWSSISAVCFLLVFLAVRGNMIVKKNTSGRSMRWQSKSFESYAIGTGDEMYGMLVGRVGKTMAWFPVVYITLTLPISVIRVLETYGFETPVYTMTIAAIVYLLLGIANPVIYVAVRHSLGHSPLQVEIGSDDSRRNSIARSKSPTESFSTPPERRPSLPFLINSSSPASTPTFPNRPPQPFPATPIRREQGEKSRTLSVIAVRSRPLPQLPAPPRPSRSPSTDGIGRLSPVPETSQPGTRAPTPMVLLPPAALIPSRGGTPVLGENIMSPDQLSKLVYGPPSPRPVPGPTQLPKEADKEDSASESSLSVYSTKTTIRDVEFAPRPLPPLPTGPLPPPRNGTRARRSPIPSVPIDVDESDQGSLIAANEFPKELAERRSEGEKKSEATLERPQRPPDSGNSLRTFWDAYESAPSSNGPLPLTPTTIPADAQTVKSRDTLHKFYAGYAGSDNGSPDVPDFSQAVQYQRPPVSISVVDSPTHRPQGSMSTVHSPSHNPQGSLSTLHSPAYTETMTLTSNQSFSVKEAYFSTVGMGSGLDLGRSGSAAASTIASSTRSGLRFGRDDSHISPAPSIRKKVEHRRSRSYTAGMPRQPAAAFMLTPPISRQPSSNALSTKSSLQVAAVPSLHRRTLTPTKLPPGPGYL